MRGKRGRPDVQEFSYRLENNLFILHQRLKNGIWRHGRYETFYVCDPKLRKIHKASVSDRIVHHAIARVIEIVFDNSFIFDAWSCRKGKGTHAAVLRCQHQLERLSRNDSRKVWVLQCDIRKYFENINHSILFEAIERKIAESSALELIREVIESFSPGLPLGNLTSQLFANVYLNPFDHFIKERLRAPIYLRYCDDFLLAHSSRDWLLEQIAAIQDFLKTRLALLLHPNKIQLRPFHFGIDWLGYVLFPRYRIVRPRTRKRMWRRIRLVVNEYLSGTCSRQSLSSAFASYAGLLKYGWNNEDRKRLFYLLRCL